MVGSPIANRHHHEVEGLIGFFVNTLALRTGLSRSLIFTNLLKQVRTMLLGAYAHQDLPFEHLVEALQPQRSMSHHPIFQVMLVLENTPTSTLELNNLEKTCFDSGLSVARFDLTLNLVKQNEQLLGSFQYAADLFDERTISRMVSYFKQLIIAVLDNPKEKVARLEMLSVKQRKQLLLDWNATTKSYPRNRCIHRLFAVQVSRTSHNTALVFEGEKLTYSVLNSKANQLARYLQKLGVKAETLISFDASIAEMLLSALSGCQLHIANSEIRGSANNLSQFIKDNQIIVLHLTPAVLQLLQPNELSSVKTVVVMGDKCRLSVIRKWCEKVQFYGFVKTELKIAF